MAVKFILLALVLSSFLTSCLSEQRSEVTVSTDCNNVTTVPCIELDGALQNLSSNIQLSLKPGEHVLHMYHGRHLVGLHDVSIIGAKGAEPVRITCDDEIGMTFINTSHLVISNIVVDGCGLSNASLHDATDIVNGFLDLHFLIPKSIRIGLFLAHCTNLSMSDSVITKTVGLGFLGVNIVGWSRLNNVSFTHNIRPSCIKEDKRFPFHPDQNFFNQIGGGAYLLYQDYKENLADQLENRLSLSYCSFKFNAECSYAGNFNVNYQYFSNAQYVIGGGGGLSIFTPQRNYNVTAIVSDANFFANDARYGSGAHIGIFAGFTSSVIQFFNCIFDSNGLPIQEEQLLNISSSAEGGAGIAIFMDLLSYSNANHRSSNCDVCKEIFFHNTTFTRNSAVSQGGAVFGYSFSNGFCTNHNILDPGAILVFDTCRFQNNSAKYGSGLFVSQRVAQSLDGSWMVIFNGAVMENNRPEYMMSHEYKAGSRNDLISAVDIRGMVVRIEGRNLTVRNNLGSGLHLTSSIVLMGPGSSLIVHGNRAHRGAGIYMDGDIPVILPSPCSQILIENNVATAEGGGIYFEQEEGGSLLGPFSSRDCFISTIDTYNGTLGEHMFDSNITLEFKGNVAPIGSIIFGATLNSCSWATKFNLEAKDLFNKLYNNYNSTFMFNELPNGTDRVSTSPHFMNITNSSISSYPGQQKYIDVHVLDIFGKDIEAVLTSDTVDEAGYNITLGNSDFWYSALKHPVALNVKGEGGNSITLSLLTTVNLVRTDLKVEILKCPIGFDDDGNVCHCSDYLKVHGIDCDSQKVEIKVPKQTWLGCDHWSNETECLSADDLILLECYFGYCNPRVAVFNQSDYTNLCAEGFKRTGLMCGHCEEGYSITLGSTKCVKCAKTDLGIIMGVTIVWGLLLVTIIALFGITIDKGWTNMLILFCNIVFPYTSYQASARIFRDLLIPAHLITLEPGYNSCLFNEANAFARVGFSILFPAYLYILMLIFAVLCRFSSFLSRNFAPHKTLVTITFMLYVVVFQACAQILSPLEVKNLSEVLALAS